MRSDQFKQMSVKEVRRRASGEKSVQRGKPFYFNRPWSQLLDEMEGAGAATVSGLDAARVEEFYAAVSSPQR